jgi:hypothetical protein
MQIMFSVIITALAILIIITAAAAAGRAGGSNKLRVQDLTITKHINTRPIAHLLTNQLIREAS